MAPIIWVENYELGGCWIRGPRKRNLWLTQGLLHARAEAWQEEMYTARRTTNTHESFKRPRSKERKHTHTHTIPDYDFPFQLHSFLVSSLCLSPWGFQLHLGRVGCGLAIRSRSRNHGTSTASHCIASHCMAWRERLGCCLSVSRMASMACFCFYFISVRLFCELLFFYFSYDACVHGVCGKGGGRLLSFGFQVFTALGVLDSSASVWEGSKVYYMTASTHSFSRYISSNEHCK